MSQTLPTSAAASPLLCVVLGPGSSREDLRDGLLARGYQLIREQPRRARQFLTWWFAPEAQAQDADPASFELGYEEDHILGQRRFWGTSLPADALDTLKAWLTVAFAAKSLPEVTARAWQAEAANDKVATLGMWGALATWPGELDAAGLDLLRARLRDEHLAVRKAAVLVASYIDRIEVAELLVEHRQDPALAVEIDRQLALRRYGLLSPDEQARRQLEDEIATAPLAPELYLRHAQVLAAMQQPNFALLEAQIALALARRDGWPLHELQLLTDTLRAQVAPATEQLTTFLAERLHALLVVEAPHVVVEVSELLLPVFSPTTARLPLLLAGALAHRALGRWLVAATQLGSLLDALESPDEQAAPRFAPPQIAVLRFMRARLFADAQACDAAIAEAEQALRWLASPPLVPPTLATSSVVAQALAALLSPEEPASRRALLFFCMQTLAAEGRYAEALDRATPLAAEEPNAADVQLACAALLNRLHEPAAALRACDRARAVLRPIDQLMEDEDPLASLLLESAQAWAELQQALAAEDCIGAALQVDPRCIERIAGQPDLAVILAASPRLAELRSEALAALSDPDPRTKARHEAAACLRSLPSGSALATLLLDFFVAGLSIVDAGPQSSSPSMVMSLLSSVEAQLDVLAESGESAAHAPLVNAAIAAMAEAMGL